MAASVSERAARIDSRLGRGDWAAREGSKGSGGMWLLRTEVTSEEGGK